MATEVRTELVISSLLFTRLGSFALVADAFARNSFLPSSLSTQINFNDNRAVTQVAARYLCNKYCSFPPFAL